MVSRGSRLDIVRPIAVDTGRRRQWLVGVDASSRQPGRPARYAFVRCRFYAFPALASALPVKRGGSGWRLLIGVFFLGAASAQVVRLGGTGAALGSMALLAKAYQQREPGFQFEIVPNLGSAGGVRALNAGAIHLAVIGRALKPQEAATGLQVLPYGQTAFVLVSNKPGIEGLSVAQFGRDVRWQVAAMEPTASRSAWFCARRLMAIRLCWRRSHRA